MIDQPIRMGIFGGLPRRVLMALSSFALVFLVVTGTILWWKRVVT